MKLKNTLGIAIGSFVAATSFGALAQGQGAVMGAMGGLQKAGVGNVGLITEAP